jgi:uncharacterized repeat protein (TIGR03803 family)
MVDLSAWKKACVTFLFLAAAEVAPAQAFNTLVIFDVTNGYAPTGPLVQGADGNLYGTTSAGGSRGPLCPAGCGTIFKVIPQGNLKTVYEFCAQANCPDGYEPYAGLVLGNDGTFYGATYNGGNTRCNAPYGCGTVFKITPAGKLTTLHDFNSVDGAHPYVALVQAADGNFYGTTVLGGANGCNGNGCGTIFTITPGGTLTNLYSFCGQPNCADGFWPYAGLVQGADGALYGSASGGLGDGYGAVFKITTTGKFTTLHSFVGYPIEGSNPWGGLIQAADGKFYGTTFYGYRVVECSFYNSGCGTIFEMTPSGALTTVHNFAYTDGAFPSDSLIQATDNNFYGTTTSGGPGHCAGGAGCGTIFEIKPDGALLTLQSFLGADGASPNSALFQATNGTFYGTSQAGGDYRACEGTGCGTVFSLDMGLGPFVAFVRAAGRVGQTGGILGQGFTGTTSVSFNGISASFTFVSDTFIKATVPAGATTGYVTVTTPSGTLTSNVPFHVIQ